MNQFARSNYIKIFTEIARRITALYTSELLLFTRKDFLRADGKWCVTRELWLRKLKKLPSRGLNFGIRKYSGAIISSDVHIPQLSTCPTSRPLSSSFFPYKLVLHIHIYKLCTLLISPVNNRGTFSFSFSLSLSLSFSPSHLTISWFRLRSVKQMSALYAFLLKCFIDAHFFYIIYKFKIY